MVEADWLEDAPQKLLHYIAPRSTERKLRLLSVACLRHLWHALPADVCREAVELGEMLADGAADPLALHAVRERLQEGKDQAVARSDFTTAALYLACETPVRATMGSRYYLPQLVGYAPGNRHYGVWGPQRIDPPKCVLIREVFGDPFSDHRPDAALLAWSDRLIPNLAAGIYAEHAFDRLPILGDALEDAGCTDAALLDHVRGPGSHARGCWVLDLLLGQAGEHGLALSE